MKKNIYLIIGVLLMVCFGYSNFELAKATTYTEGYFEYTDDGGSVTITGYFGSDETVTIPNMIAGEPVSKIAKGAFPDSCSVKNLNLPDTVVTVEEGAISQNISVTFNSNSSSLSNTTEETNTEDTNSKETNTEDPSFDNNGTTESGVSQNPNNITTNNAVLEDPNNDIAEGGYEETDLISNNKPVTGITLPNNKGYLTVNDKGNLVVVDPENNQIVIDDAKKYVLETKEEDYVIKDQDGNEVEVNQNGDIIYSDENGNKQTKTPDGKNKKTVNSSKKVFLILVIVIILIMITGIFVWLMGDKKDKDKENVQAKENKTTENKAKEDKIKQNKGE